MSTFIFIITANVSPYATVEIDFGLAIAFANLLRMLQNGDVSESTTLVPFEFKPQRECAIEDVAGGVADLIETARRERPDVFVFTDKSARPLFWVFSQAWKELYPKESHPDIRFLNIGREKTPEGFPDLTKCSPTSEEIEGYAIQAVEQFHIDDQLKELYRGQGFEEGKSIIVVEEEVGMKLSYQIVKKGLEKAFPKSSVQLFDAEIQFFGWGQAAKRGKKQEGFGERHSEDYSAAMIGVSDDVPENILTQPYYRKGEKSERVNFGNVVEGKIRRPYHYLREDIKRAVEKVVEMVSSEGGS